MPGRIFALWCLVSGSVWAGVIQGVVLERASGRPLARARVRLDAITSSGIRETAATLANRSGQFVFLSLADGHYLLSASRTGFATAWYGQTRRSSAGAPLPVSGDSAVFVELRLERWGAITGKVVDENDVGLPEVPVLAYPAALPLRSAATVKSDDRGLYRLGGLTPGRYYVRTTAHELEDASGLLPTFAPESAVLKDARLVTVDLDRESPDVDLRPLGGKLSHLSGRLTGCAGAATVTLSSDTGRRQTKAGCGGFYSFTALPPADYELLAELPDSPVPLAAFQELFLDRDREGVNLNLSPLPEVAFEFQGGDKVPLLARRKDLAGEGETSRITADRVRLLPGYWDLTTLPPSDHYLQAISYQFLGQRPSKAGLSPDWFEIPVTRFSRDLVRVIFASRPAGLSGRVLAAGEPVVGAPVWLFPVDPNLRRQVRGLQTIRTDTRGGFRFEGLAPGRYLALASFDSTEMTEDALLHARAADLRLGPGQTIARDLDLYRLP